MGIELYYNESVTCTRNTVTGHSTRQAVWSRYFIGPENTYTRLELEEFGWVLVAPEELVTWKLSKETL